jgi:copper chaperone CopZ
MQTPHWMKVCELKITGMACEICAARVEKEAKKIDGVKSVTVDQPKGVAEITYAED